MFKTMKRLLAAACVFALVATVLPTVPVRAAGVPKFKKTYTGLYENGTGKGKYTYTLQNLQKGQIVKWSVSGAGKAYVSVKKASKTAAKSTMDNIVTVKTNGKTAAKNKKITLTAKVYSKAGKLQYTVSTSAKIKVKPTKVTITAPKEADNVLSVGESYAFSYKLTPVNATSTNQWTVTGEDGKDYSEYMSSAGVFKPVKAGIYTIKASAMIGKKAIKTASVVVEVVDYMVNARQTAANKIEVTYSGDMRGILEVDNFTVTNAAGANIVAKSLDFSADGKSMTITMFSNFKDGVTYSITDDVTTREFKASVGTPVKLEILTSQATVDKETTIEYALYDKNGIDVSVVYEGKMEYEAEVTNGYLTDGNKLFMKTIGKTATVTLKYTSKSDSSLVLTDSDVITCVAAVTSDKTNFTLTTSTSAPDYSAVTYKDNRKVSIGTTYYTYFRALDTDDSEIKYSSLSFESSDPDTLIISAAGKVTPIKNGTVKIIVTAVYAGETYTYSYDVTIAEAAYLKKIKLSTDRVNMSNVYNPEYYQYIDVTATDQYGEDFPLNEEAANIADNNNSYKANIATYDAANNQIKLRTSNVASGTYSYTLTLTCNGKKATASFTVVVSSVPVTGETTYEIEIDKKTADLSLSKDVVGNQYVTVRLAQYRGGVFVSYASFSSATVTKNGEYFSTDLTLGGSTAVKNLTASNRLYLQVLDINNGVCRKADTGTYTISLQYYSAADKAYKTQATTLTLTDTQDRPQVQIDRTTATKSCGTALELAQNCLSLNNGAITECVVTGEAEPGSKVILKSGDQINIRSITVVTTYKIAGGQDVTVTYTISVGKTLTNG